MRTNRLLTGLLLALIAMLNLQTVEAQSPIGQNALYNYRNDGQFNAWLNIDIDSITYSRVDTLGIEHDDIVVQEVWTPDSLYRIPIEAIDSIGFQRPNTIFKPGIFIIEQKHLPYIISSDGTYVLFRYGSPAKMMPHKGQIVYSDLEEEPFPMGFAGRVVEIIENSEGFNFVCKPVSPSEVYEKYLDVVKIYSEGDDNVIVADANSRPQRIKRNIADDGTINIPSLKFSASLGGVSVEAKVTYTIDYAFSVGITDKDFASLIVKRETEFTTELDVKLDKIEGYEKEEWLPWPIYTLGAGNKLGFTLNAGLFFEYKGSLNLTAKLPYKSTHTDNYFWSSDQPFQYLENKSDGWPGWEEYLTSGDVELKMKGSVAFGPILEASFQIWKPSFLSIDARAKGGLELSGEISLNLNELMTDGFDAYKTVSEDMKITTGLKVGGEIGYTIKEDFEKLLSADVTLFKKERYLFPRFTRPSLPFKTENGWEGDVKPLSMFSVPSNLLFFPGKVGLAVYDDAGKSISKTYGQSWFFGGDDWPKSWLQTDISGLQQGKTYTVKPIFRMLNIFDVVATPNYQFMVPDHLSVAQSEIKLQKGASKFIIINDGWGDFKVEVDHPNYVTAQIKETASSSTSSVQIDGLAAGKARVKVIDLRNGDVAEIAVEVTNDAVTESTIKVEPSTIDFGTVLQGNSKTEYFNVSNTGKYDIRLKVSKPHAPFEIPEAGNVFTLTPGNTKKFAVTCTGLTPGEANKSVFIAIGSNASNSDALGVTLTANGGGGSVGHMKVEPTSIDFGKVEYLSTKKKKLLVTNDGTGKLSFHSSYHGNAAFNIEDNGKEISLNPGETKEISVTCQGMMESQEAIGEITLVSSTGQDNTVVRLAAVGAPPTTFTLEKTTVNAPAGSVTYVNILFGSKNYSVSNGNTDLVSVIIDTDNNYDYPYGRVKLLAMDEGQTVVKITDQKEKKTVSLTVTLKEDASNPFIEFSDSEVERVCLSCWDVNGDGKLSKKEAAAVSDLNGVFMYNKKIRSFTELRYFTGLNDLNLDFYDCSRLEDVILPKNLKSIGWNTFYECDYLKNIHIPQNVSSIDGLSFQWSTNLESITVSPANTIYDSRDNCNAVIQTETNTLNNGCYTTKIPSSVTAIGYCAFWGQSRLTQIDLPSSITFISDGAFGGCRLKEVNLPASVINIDGAPFGCCYEIKRITVEPGNSVYDSREECNAIINSHTNELMQGCQNSTIPSTVTSIGMNAFKWQYYLKSISIPDNVSKIGDCAFYGCNRLEDVYISANVTSIGEGAFGDCSDLSSIVVSPSNPVYDSRNNSNTIIETATNTLLHANEYSTIPDGITTIGAYALAGYGKRSLSLPEGVTTIRYHAFRESSLRSLTLPSTLNDLGSAPFWECYDLNDIVCYAKEPPYVWGFDEGDQTFDVENATLHVRDASLDKYRNAQYWEDFESIVALPQKPAEAIDLGLPSGTKWASYDVGAYNIGEVGDYYAWGETEPKDSYLWSTYTHCDDGTDATRHDLGNIIGTEYDVAHVKWGGDWHMPSNDQINELITFCTYEWTSFNGINGYKFISKSNGESIFLPAAGWYSGDYHMSNGEECQFWSGNSAGSRFSFNLFASGKYGVRNDFSDCAEGMTVRPVIGSGPVAIKYIKVEPQSIDFGTMEADTSETEYIKVANIGSGTINFHFDYTSDFITVTGGDKENIVLEVGQTHTFPVVCTIPKDCQSSGETITIYVRSDADNEKEVAVRTSVSIIPSSDTVVPAEAIDLGLPSGTRWASYNVGATKPEEYGGYYAWGEIETKKSYSWSNYIHSDGSSETCHDIGTDISGTEFDVAHMKWGDDWRMPTRDQMQELIDHCTAKWTFVNGVNGTQFTGPNGASIFLPAAGHYWEKYLLDEGNCLYYWASTVDFSYFACNLYYDTDFTRTLQCSNCSRDVGQPIRPVMAGEPPTPSEIPSEAIDLGLPSGTRWASYNVGATKPEEFGGYYAWGETEVKEDYTEENYLYNGQNLGSNICGTEYDVAHVKWGKNWQMPTKKQIEELISKCTYEVVDINGISGGKFIGPNGNSVFFPSVYIGWGESYWSGTPSDEESDACVLNVQRGCGTIYNLSRYHGYCVRPVEVSNMIPPAITVVPEDIHFGVVKLGTDKSKELTVTNTGNASVTVTMDGCTNSYSNFDVSNNQEEVILAPGESKVYTVTAHGTKAGCAPTQLLLINCDGLEEAIKVKISSYGDDDEPIIDVTELSLNVGETAAVKVRNSGYYSSKPDVDDIVELGGGGGPGAHGGPIDRHEPFDNYSESNMTVKALKAGVVHVVFTDHHTNHTSVLTVAVTDGSTADIPAEAIDLGLPSGNLWASYNVGTTKLEEAGGYYAWGETEEKESYDWDSYLHRDENIGSDIQGTEYDVAHVKWGGDWVIPNNNDIDELIIYCSSENVTLNGVNCLKFTGSNGQYIYLPDCEYWSSNHHDMVDTAYYWGAVTLNKGYVSKSQPPYVGKNVRPILIPR